jgi:hypothetical protein
MEVLRARARKKLNQSSSRETERALVYFAGIVLETEGEFKKAEGEG